jgi:arsenite transporter
MAVVNKRLGLLDRFLTLWIFAAIGLGLIAGRYLPFLREWLSSPTSEGVNLPIAVGLIVMMYPPLVRVDFSKLPDVFKDVRLLSLSLVQNWLIGPLLMLALAALFLPDKPEYMTGLVLIGIARCIAMVIVWNDLAGGSKEYVAGLVAFNSVFQILFYSIYAYFFLDVLLPAMGFEAVNATVSSWLIAESVLVYLGVPFFAALISRWLIIKTKGELWLRTRFIPFISPLTLFALLFTIVVMFSLKGDVLINLPLDTLRIAIPLSLYFLIMFSVAFYLSMRSGSGYEKATSLAFTAAGNNFELGIAVAISVFGLHSGVAFAAVVGPLIEVPVLILMVKLALYWKQRFFHSSAA